MQTLISAILDSLAATVRQSADLALVTVGAGPADTATPRAAVISDGLTFYPTDDENAKHWIRLRARIVIRDHREDACFLLGQLDYLAQQAREAILQDRFRGGLCRDLPIGRATEVSQCEPPDLSRRPNGESVLVLRCHAETSEYPS